jgi:hypothetical protein
LRLAGFGRSVPEQPCIHGATILIMHDHKKSECCISAGMRMLILPQLDSAFQLTFFTKSRRLYAAR